MLVLIKPGGLLVAKGFEEKLSHFFLSLFPFFGISGPLTPLQEKEEIKKKKRVNKSLLFWRREWSRGGAQNFYVPDKCVCCWKPKSWNGKMRHGSFILCKGWCFTLVLVNQIAGLTPVFLLLGTWLIRQITYKRVHMTRSRSRSLWKKQKQVIF